MSHLLTEQLCFIRQLPRICFSANNLNYCGVSLDTVPGTDQRKETWAPGPLQSPAGSPSPGTNTWGFNLQTLDSVKSPAGRVCLGWTEGGVKRFLLVLLI